MNWKQLYTTSTEEERLEALLHMLHTIEARQNKIILVLPLSKSHFDLGRGKGWGLIRNRRRNVQPQYHLIGEKRGRHVWSRITSILTILTALFATLITSILITVNLPPQISTQLIFFPITAIMFVLLFKPRQPLIIKRKS